MKDATLLSIALIFSISFFKAQSDVSVDIRPLKYITSDPVKSEDGGSHFSDNLNSLKQKKYLLNINFGHTAYFQIADDKFIYFKRIRRTSNTAGYIDFYKGKTGEFKLMINSIKKGTNYTSRRNGVLSLHIGKIIKQLHVYGSVQDNDEINRRLFGY
ncbi:MAG: hypothetical protein ACHQF4_09720 [Sphingobacteriales bacterium]